MQERLCSAFIKRVHDRLERDANNTLRAQDLTMAQVGVLIELYCVPEKQMPLKELERLLHVAQSTAAGIVVRLEQKGFVESFGDPNDRRIKMIRITSAGEKCCRIANQDMKMSEEKLLSVLSASEQSTFLDLLQKVCNSLS